MGNKGNEMQKGPKSAGGNCAAHILHVHEECMRLAALTDSKLPSERGGPRGEWGQGESHIWQLSRASRVGLEYCWGLNLEIYSIDGQ